MDGRPASPAQPFRLDGRTALITGAARGIGYATALRVLEAGANVAINDIDRGTLEVAAEDLGGAGPPNWPHNASLSAAVASTARSGDIRRRLPIQCSLLAHLQVGTSSAGIGHATCLLAKVQMRSASRPEEGS